MFSKRCQKQRTGSARPWRSGRSTKCSHRTLRLRLARPCAAFVWAVDPRPKGCHAHQRGRASSKRVPSPRGTRTSERPPAAATSATPAPRPASRLVGRSDQTDPSRTRTQVAQAMVPEAPMCDPVTRQRCGGMAPPACQPALEWRQGCCAPRWHRGRCGRAHWSEAVADGADKTSARGRNATSAAAMPSTSGGACIRGGPPAWPLATAPPAPTASGHVVKRRCARDD